MEIILRSIVCLLVLGSGTSAHAIEIQVGTRPIDIPLVGGFVPLTSEMSPYYESMRAYIGPDNTRYATLIHESIADQLIGGQPTDLYRYINIETMTAVSSQSITPAQFSEFQEIYRGQLKKIYADSEKLIADALADGDRRLGDEYGLDIAIALNGQSVFAIHQDTERSISNSVLSSVGGVVGNTDIEGGVIAATTTFVYVADKILFLYVYGSEEDLEWTRETSRRWASNILAANPFSVAELEDTQEDILGRFDWLKIAEKGVIGAVLGGLISLVVLGIRKLNKRT